MDELMMENDERPKCACGCGMPVDCKLRSGAWGNYCHGHKKCPPVESDRHLCNCGCGNYVNWNSRTKEYNLYCKGHRLNNPLDAERRSTVAKNVYVNNPKLKEIRSNSSKAMWAKQEFRAGIKSRYRHKYEALHPEILDDPPLCACGCGGCVSFSRNKTEWNKYIKHHYKKQRKELDRPLCACGCGILVEKKRDGGWRKYCVGHNRGSVAKPERPLCACGCGNPVKWNREKKIWRNYIIGHSSRDTNFRKRQSDMMKSKWETVEYREFYKLVSERG